MLSKVFILFVAVSFACGNVLKPRHELYPTGGKIVGGSAAAAGEIPFQVSIQTSGGSQSCGGSILNSRSVLTAAHCSEVNPNLYRIRSGTLRYATGGDLYEVSSIIVHVGWNSAQKNLNDIAIWRISGLFSLTGDTGAVTLPPSGAAIAAGTMCTVSGWGTTSFGGSVSEILLKVDVPIVSKASCGTSYGGIGANQICAGYDQGGADSCQGDSGGPLFNRNGQWGIVSYGNGCARPGYPGVYTEVSQYISWINNNQ